MANQHTKKTTAQFHKELREKDGVIKLAEASLKAMQEKLETAQKQRDEAITAHNTLADEYNRLVVKHRRVVYKLNAAGFSIPSNAMLEDVEYPGHGIAFRGITNPEGERNWVREKFTETAMDSCSKKAAKGVPYFMLTAGDNFAPILVQNWIRLAMAHNVNEDKISEAKAVLRRIENYRTECPLGCKIPD